MTTQPCYDVIVVGAGSSGAALGARLAERGQKALLLEAGRNYASSELPEEWRSPNPAAAIVVRTSWTSFGRTTWPVAPHPKNPASIGEVRGWVEAQPSTGR
ncbi:NAD(P)-binding protein [Rhodococcus sp. 2.95]